MCTIRLMVIKKWNSIFLPTLVMVLFVNAPCWAEENGYATLTVVRLKAFTAMAQNVHIYLDGQKIGTIGNGDTVHFSIPAKKDKQTLVLKDFMGFLRSDELQIKVSANDTVLLEFYCNMFSDSITKLIVENDTHTSQIARNENRNLVKIIELKLDQRLKLKAIKESPVYRIPNGQEKLVEDSVRLVHTVTTTDESSLDSSLKLNWGLIEAGIRNEVQKSTSRSKAIEAEVKRSVKITGDGQAVKVIWSELYRTGTAKIEINGRVSDIAFECKEDFDLSLEVAD